MNNRKLLLVEDDRDFSESLRLLLQMKGFDVTLAYSGEEAIDIYRAGEFCYILMDIKLPGMSGIETLNHLMEHYAEAKILLMTGCERGSDEVASANMTKAIGVLYKPFRINDLLNFIDG
jgi:DNA-binding response OmpR family regulator